MVENGNDVASLDKSDKERVVLVKNCNKVASLGKIDKERVVLVKNGNNVASLDKIDREKWAVLVENGNNVALGNMACPRTRGAGVGPARRGRRSNASMKISRSCRS